MKRQYLIIALVNLKIMIFHCSILRQNKGPDKKTNRLGGHAKVSMTSGLTSFIHVRWHNSSGICPGQPFVVEDFSAVVDSTLVDD